MQLIKDLGGHRKVAEELGITPASVYGWKQIPQEHCADLERLSGGKIKVEAMRPDVRFVRVPDPKWPHPKGRPCIDTARRRPRQ